MKKVPQIAMSEWRQLFIEAKEQKVEKVEDGFKTIHEISEEIGMSRPHAQRLIAQLAEAGMVEKRKFVVINGERGLYPTPHYRIKKRLRGMASAVV